MGSQPHIYTLRTSCYTCNQGARSRSNQLAAMRLFQMERSGAERDRVNLTGHKKGGKCTDLVIRTTWTVLFERDDLHESQFCMWLQEQVLIGSIKSTLVHTSPLFSQSMVISDQWRSRVCASTSGETLLMMNQEWILHMHHIRKQHIPRYTGYGRVYISKSWDRFTWMPHNKFPSTVIICRSKEKNTLKKEKISTVMIYILIMWCEFH